MKIDEKKLIEIDACKEGVEMFRQYPGLKGGRAELGALCRWAASEGAPGYVFWLLPRLMEPEGAAKWAILAAKRHYHDADWNKWADSWLSREDRTPESAAVAEVAESAKAVVRAARAATWAAMAGTAWEAWEAAWEAEWAVAYAYDAAEDKAAEIELQIADAMEILSVDGKSEKEKAE